MCACAYVCACVGVGFRVADKYIMESNAAAVQVQHF